MAITSYYKLYSNSTDFANWNNWTDTAITYVNGWPTWKCASLNGSTSKITATITDTWNPFTRLVWINTTQSGSQWAIFENNTTNWLNTNLNWFVVNRTTAWWVLNWNISFHWSVGWPSNDLVNAASINNWKWRRIWWTRDSSSNDTFYIDWKPVAVTWWTIGSWDITWTQLYIWQLNNWVYPYSWLLNELIFDTSSFWPAKIKNDYMKYKGFF